MSKIANSVDELFKVFLGVAPLDRLIIVSQFLAYKSFWENDRASPEDQMFPKRDDDLDQFHAIRRLYAEVQETNPDLKDVFNSDYLLLNSRVIGQADLAKALTIVQSSFNDLNSQRKHVVEALIRHEVALSNKIDGALLTPKPLSDLLISLVDPQSGQSIYDPWGRSGRMLLSAINHIEKTCEEGAASSGRQSAHDDRHGKDPRKRPMEESVIRRAVREALIQKLKK